MMHVHDKRQRREQPVRKRSEVRNRSAMLSSIPLPPLLGMLK